MILIVVADIIKVLFFNIILSKALGYWNGYSDDQVLFFIGGLYGRKTILLVKIKGRFF